MYILGISAFYHDSAACLLSDGEIIAAAQEERFTRIKGDPSFPARAVEYCFARAGIGAQDLSHVGFYDKPILKLERILETYLSVAPAGLRSFLLAGPLWVKEKLDIEGSIRRALDYEGPILFSEHHESHAASAFFPSPFEEAAILTMDGVGEWATATIGHGQGADFELLHELRWPDSPGLLYSAFTAYLGFKVNEGEYKVMGLAPYGRPVHRERILDEMVDLRDDGSFRLNQKYFNYLSGLTMTSGAFHRLFGGPPRIPGSPITQREMDLACSIQSVCEEIVLRMAGMAHRSTGSRNLALAGGVALNCVANGRVIREGPFEQVWIQPAAGDAGGAVGVARLLWHRHRREQRPVRGDRMSGALLGPGYSDAQVAEALAGLGARFERLPDAQLLPRVARLLAGGSVIGWFDGRAEFGPRALGARSIVADPRDPEMRDRINSKIKFREGFRPFAPSVLRERLGDYFELDRESPYMLLVARVKDGVEIPAVTHVDRSARIQTVAITENPRFHALIEEFERLTACAVLVNTSFNSEGEPIVGSPYDAYRTFMRSGLDHMVIGPFLLDKADQPPFTESSVTPADGPPLSLPARAYQLAVRAAHLISRVTNPVLLGIVYLAIVTPIGLVWRVVTGGLRGRNRRATSFWRPRPPGNRRSDLERQF